MKRIATLPKKRVRRSSVMKSVFRNQGYDPAQDQAVKEYERIKRKAASR